MPQDVGAELVALVEQEHGPAALLVRGGREPLLQAADEHRVGAGGLGAARDRDLAAHVALGQAGDLDVVDVVARLGQRVAQTAEQRGLAGAGRRDQCRRHAGLDGSQEPGKRLVEERQAEVVIGGDLARERDRVEAEGGAQIGGLGGEDGSGLGHRGLPFVVDAGGEGAGNPQSGPTTGAKARAKASCAAVRGAASSSSGAGAGGMARRATALAARSTGARVTSAPSWTTDSAPESRCRPTVISVPAWPRGISKSVPAYEMTLSAETLRVSVTTKRAASAASLSGNRSARVSASKRSSGVWPPSASCGCRL